MKALARYRTLLRIVQSYEWGWALTSWLDKGHAYQLDQHGEVTRETATSVRSGLYGAEKLASAFGVSLKGFLVLLELYPDLAAVKGMKKDLFDNIFDTDDQKLAKSLLTKRRGRHF